MHFTFYLVTNSILDAARRPSGGPSTSHTHKYGSEYLILLQFRTKTFSSSELECVGARNPGMMMSCFNKVCMTSSPRWQCHNHEQPAPSVSQSSQTGTVSKIRVNSLFLDTQSWNITTRSLLAALCITNSGKPQYCFIVWWINPCGTVLARAGHFWWSILNGLVWLVEICWFRHWKIQKCHWYDYFHQINTVQFETNILQDHWYFEIALVSAES